MAVAHKNLDDIPNTQERRAYLIVDMLYDKAQRMVDAMDEPPPGMQQPNSDRVRAMWRFSPYPNPEAAFWEVHDLALTQAMQAIMQQPQTDGVQLASAIEDAHTQAETAALQKVYPYRAQVMLLGVTTPQRSVDLARRAQRLAEADDKKQPQAEMNPMQEAPGY